MQAEIECHSKRWGASAVCARVCACVWIAIVFHWELFIVPCDSAYLLAIGMKRIRKIRFNLYFRNFFYSVTRSYELINFSLDIS